MGFVGILCLLGKRMLWKECWELHCPAGLHTLHCRLSRFSFTVVLTAKAFRSFHSNKRSINFTLALPRRRRGARHTAKHTDKGDE